MIYQFIYMISAWKKLIKKYIYRTTLETKRYICIYIYMECY